MRVNNAAGVKAPRIPKPKLPSGQTIMLNDLMKPKKVHLKLVPAKNWK